VVVPIWGINDFRDVFFATMAVFDLGMLITLTAAEPSPP
jgi:hypothetical protein